MSETVVRILYMEDDPGLSRLLQKRLERKGYTVDLAEDGEIGLNMIEKESYDLLLVDHNMPGYCGLDVIRHLNSKGKTVPIIMVTANGSEKVAVEAMKLGAADYIVKDPEMGYLDLLPIIIEQIISKQELIKERQRMLRALQESEERYRKLVELSPDGIAVNVEGKFVFVNPGGAKLLRAEDPEHLLGKPVLSYIRSDNVDSFGERLKELEMSGNLIPWSEEIFVCEDGTELNVEVAGIPFRYQESKAVQIIFRDITERKNAERRLEYLALYDALTGLPNRVMFFDRLKQCLIQAKRYNYVVSLLFLDLDRFKAVNDTLGHDIGDMLLKEAARRLTECARESDTVARMGGDEFTIILSKVNEPRDSEVVARRIISSLSLPFELNGNQCSIGVSIGIAVYPADSDDADFLLKKADAAMYLAKENGRNGYRYYSARQNVA